MISMRLYDNTGKVPENVQFIIEIVQYRCWGRYRLRKNKQVDIVSNSSDTLPEKVIPVSRPEKILNANSNKSESKGPDKDPVNDITWNTVGKILDKACIAILLLVFIIYSTTMTFDLYLNCK